MKTISSTNDTILKLLNKFRVNEKAERWLQYCVETSVEDGHLLCNLLTREMVLLTDMEDAELC